MQFQHFHFGFNLFNMLILVKISFFCSEILSIFFYSVLLRLLQIKTQHVPDRGKIQTDKFEAISTDFIAHSSKQQSYVTI